MGSLVNILWTVAVILIALWAIGFVLGWAATGAGWLLHLLLVAAIVVIAYNLLTNRRAA
jgi:ABC-type iron transport system FetAB permease component